MNIVTKSIACDGGARPAACDLCDVRERSICRDLGPRDLAHVERVMSRKTVAKGRAIISEGEPNETLFVVVSGSFRLTKYLEDGRRQVTGFLFKGDFVGVRSTKENPYTAEALEESLVCHFPHRFLDETSRDSPGVKDRLIARAQTEYHKAQDHIVLLGKKTAEERVQSFLEMLAEAPGSSPVGGVRRARLPMPRQDIADYLGLRLETLSRTLAVLKKKGMIEEIGRSEVMLAD